MDEIDRQKKKQKLILLDTRGYSWILFFWILGKFLGSSIQVSMTTPHYYWGLNGGFISGWSTSNWQKCNPQGCLSTATFPCSLFEIKLNIGVSVFEILTKEVQGTRGTSKALKTNQGLLCSNLDTHRLIVQIRRMEILLLSPFFYVLLYSSIARKN